MQRVSPALVVLLIWSFGANIKACVVWVVRLHMTQFAGSLDPLGHPTNILRKPRRAHKHHVLRFSLFCALLQSLACREGWSLHQSFVRLTSQNQPAFCQGMLVESFRCSFSRQGYLHRCLVQGHLSFNILPWAPDFRKCYTDCEHQYDHRLISLLCAMSVGWFFARRELDRLLSFLLSVRWKLLRLSWPESFLVVSSSLMESQGR